MCSCPRVLRCLAWCCWTRWTEEAVLVPDATDGLSSPRWWGIETPSVAGRRVRQTGALVTTVFSGSIGIFVAWSEREAVGVGLFRSRRLYRPSGGFRHGGLCLVNSIGSKRLKIAGWETPISYGFSAALIVGSRCLLPSVFGVLSCLVCVDVVLSPSCSAASSTVSMMLIAVSCAASVMVWSRLVLAAACRRRSDRCLSTSRRSCCSAGVRLTFRRVVTKPSSNVLRYPYTLLV